MTDVQQDSVKASKEEDRKCDVIWGIGKWIRHWCPSVRMVRAHSIYFHESEGDSYS